MSHYCSKCSVIVPNHAAWCPIGLAEQGKLASKDLIALMEGTYLMVDVELRAYSVAANEGRTADAQTHMDEANKLTLQARDLTRAASAAMLREAQGARA